MLSFKIIYQGLYGIQPLNQDSFKYLEQQFDIPEESWLGSICYLSDQFSQHVINELEYTANIEVFTPNGYFSNTIT